MKKAPATGQRYATPIRLLSPKKTALLEPAARKIPGTSISCCEIQTQDIVTP